MADGKVYIGTERGDLWVFAAADTERVLARVRLHKPICSTPVVANGVLYVACRDRLYAVKARPGGSPRVSHDPVAMQDILPFRSADTP